MVVERMAACMREGTQGLPGARRRAPVALGDASGRASLGRGRENTAGQPGRPPPARRAGPSRPARPAGTARGRHWACSDGGQVAPRASFRAARTRDLPGRSAPPDASGTGQCDPSGPGAGRGAAGGRGRARRHPAPTRPWGARRTRGRAGGCGGTGSPHHVGAGRGRPAALTWRGRGGRARAGRRVGLRRAGRRPGRCAGAWACAPAGQGRAQPAEPVPPAPPEDPAPPRPRLGAPRGRTARGEPAKRGDQRLAPRVNPPLGFQRWHFLGLARNSSANKSSPFRGRYGMIYQVPAVRQLQRGECM